MTTTSGKFESVLRSTTHELWEHSGAEKTRGACPQKRGGHGHGVKDPMGLPDTLLQAAHRTTDCLGFRV